MPAKRSTKSNGAELEPMCEAYQLRPTIWSRRRVTAGRLVAARRDSDVRSQCPTGRAVASQRNSGLVPLRAGDVTGYLGGDQTEGGPWG